MSSLVITHYPSKIATNIRIILDIFIIMCKYERKKTLLDEQSLFKYVVRMFVILQQQLEQQQVLR